jgi:hypothetical protein
MGWKMYTEFWWDVFGKGHLEDRGRDEDNNISIDHWEICCENGRWMVQEHDQWL